MNLLFSVVVLSLFATLFLFSNLIILNQKEDTDHLRKERNPQKVFEKMTKRSILEDTTHCS